MSYYPLLSIPVYTLLSIFPHVYAVSISSKGNPKRHDNRNPKASDHLAKVKSTLSPRDFARFERAESCHRNGLENMPLFVATILAGIYAQRETGVPLNTTLFAALWLLDRVLYTVNYLNTETQTWTYARSLLFFAGLGLCFTHLVRSANALASTESS